MKVMSVLFARWKGAKIVIEHPMHVPRAYRVSLASLRPNQVSCLTSGNRFSMYLLYLQFALEWINIFYFRVKHCCHVLFTFVTICSNYIVNIVVCICWITADFLGAIHKLFGFPTRILYGRPTHLEVYYAAHTFLGGWRPLPRTCSSTVWDKARHTGQCWYFNWTSQDNTPG